MTRTGKSPRLTGHRDEPYVEIHPGDARKTSLQDGGFAKIKSHWGEALLRVHISKTQKPGEFFMPLHWTDAYASNAVVGKITTPATDPVSGQPDLKHTPVSVEKWTPGWHGFLLSRKRLDLRQNKAVTYWAYSHQQNCHILEIAGLGTLQENGLAKQLFGDTPVLTYKDARRGHHRWAQISDGELENCLVMSDKAALPPREWLQHLMSERKTVNGSLISLLSGISDQSAGNTGPIICSCFGVRKATIINAIACHKITDIHQLGDVTQAGTNCGSCVSDIKKILG